MFRSDLYSIVPITSHLVLSLTLVSAIGAFMLWVCRNKQATVRHMIALSALCGMVVVPPVVAHFHFWAVQTSINTPKSATAPFEEFSQKSFFSSPEEPLESGSQTTFQNTGLLGFMYWLHVSVAFVWCLGAIVSTCFKGISLLRQWQYLRRLPCVKDENIRATVSKLQKEMGICRGVELLESRHTPWPFTVGIVKPKLILPSELLRQDSDSRHLESALVHELGHILRGDYGVAMFAGIVRTLIWWNPFVYSLSKDLNVAREEICDSLVLNLKGDGKSLAEYLVVSMERAANAGFAWGVGMSANEPQTVELRIKRLMSGDNHKMKYLSKLSNGLIISCSLVLCIACVQANYAQAQFILGEPVSFGPILNSEKNDAGAFLTPDGMTIYFHGNRPGTVGGSDIYTSSRTSLESAWSQPEHFTPANTSGSEWSPFISDDGLTFLFEGPNRIIYGLSRESVEAPWGPRVALPAPINDGASGSIAPSMSADGLTLIFASDRSGGEGDFDIWEATRPSLNDPWEAHPLGPNVNTPSNNASPTISSDGLTLLFASPKAGGDNSDLDIWMSTRDAVGEEWGTAVNLGPTVNTDGTEKPSQLWKTGNLLLFKSNVLPGAGDLFYVRVVPEPASGTMAVCGLLFVIGLVRNRKPKSSFGTG